MRNIFLALAIATTSIFTGCFGYHAQLRKEQYNELQLNIACTNLINAVNELKKNPLPTPDQISQVGKQTTIVNIYHDCDGRVDTNWVNELAKCSGTNFLGVYMDMAAVWHPDDKTRYAGVAMFSTCIGYQGEYLKDISSADFEEIFVNKTKQEYSK